MADLDLHREYDSSGQCIQDLFDSTEEGFFVPPYQREYTWEEDNINQLFDDLVFGARELADSPTATTFMGTAILTTLADKKRTVVVGQERAQPTAVQLVIDGQQRISTIGLLSIQITSKLEHLLANLPQKRPYVDLHNAGDKFLARLQKLHTIELGKGATPSQKPKIISEREDRWTYDGDDDTAYHSPIARYVAAFIRTQSSHHAKALLSSEKQRRVLGNVLLMDDWLDAICDAHVPKSKLFEQFPYGETIAQPRLQEHVLGFTDPELQAIVAKAETAKTHHNYFATATFQLLFLTYYLLRPMRCESPSTHSRGVGLRYVSSTQHNWYSIDRHGDLPPPSNTVRARRRE